MSYWKLVEPIWDEVSIYDGPETFLKQFSGQPETPGLLLAAHWCQSEVCNGGFSQFFYNATGVLAPESARAFRKLAMPRVAAVVEGAMSLLGRSYPRDRTQRGLAMESLEAAHSSPFLRFDKEFFDLIETENGGFEAAADHYGAVNG